MDPTLDDPTLDDPALDNAAVDTPTLDEPALVEEKRRTLWRTAWGVVLAASSAFTLGYAMSRAAEPSVGASTPPAWPLFISGLVVAVSLWFVLAPTLHRWPFETPPGHDGAAPEPWLGELAETEEADAAPIATFTIEQAAPPPDRTPS